MGGRMRTILLFTLVVCFQSRIVGADEDGYRVLRAARDAAIRRQCVQFQFRLSTYGDRVVEFWADGVKTKCIAELPSPAAGGGTEMERCTYVFDGDTFQERTEKVSLLSFSRTPIGGKVMRGPCFTPLEASYTWMGFVQRKFNWETIRDPAIWDAMKPVQCSLRETAGERIATIEFRNHKNRPFFVSFDENRDFYPVEQIMKDESGAVLAHVTATKFVAKSGGHLPTEVYVEHSAHGPVLGRKSTYNILPETISFQCPTDPSFFHLTPIQGESIHDWDRNLTYVEGSSDRRELISRGTVKKSETVQPVTPSSVPAPEIPAPTPSTLAPWKWVLIFLPAALIVYWQFRNIRS